MRKLKNRPKRKKGSPAKKLNIRSSIADLDISSLPTRKASEISLHRATILYGRSGTGKTTIAGTFPRPLLLLDIRDKGTDSVAEYDDIEVMQINEWNDIERAYWFLKKNNDRFKSVVIDTVSQLQNIAIELAMEELGKSDLEAGNWGSLTQGEWGKVAGLLKSKITEFRDLPLEVVFIAQHRVFDIESEDDDRNRIIDPEIGPQMMPSVAKHLNASCSIIGNTFIREVEKVTKGKRKEDEETDKEYCLRIGPDPVYITRVRKPVGVKIPSVIVDPTYKDILALIKGEQSDGQKKHRKPGRRSRKR